MLKPDMVREQLIGDVLERANAEGLSVTRLRMARFDRATAAEFYAEHVGKPFFNSLTEYTASGPIIGTIFRITSI